MAAQGHTTGRWQGQGLNSITSLSCSLIWGAPMVMGAGSLAPAGSPTLDLPHSTFSYSVSKHSLPQPHLQGSWGGR